jgi:methylmalonyl-CoA mutase cobalamin-binding subunit
MDDVLVVVGGTIPDEDAEVFQPGARPVQDGCAPS